MACAKRRFLPLLSVNCTVDVYNIAVHSEPLLIFRAKSAAIGLLKREKAPVLRIVSDPPCAAVKSHKFIIYFSIDRQCHVIPGISCSHVYVANHKIKMNTDLTDWQECLAPADVNGLHSRRKYIAFRVQKHLALPPCLTEPMYAAEMTMSSTSGLKSICTCLMFGHKALNSLSIKFLRTKPRFTFTNRQLFQQFTNLRQLRLQSNMFDSTTFGDLLRSFGGIQSLRKLELDGRYINMNVLFLNFPPFVEHLILTNYREKLPVTIESARNLRKLKLDYISRTVPPEVFSLPHLFTVTFTKPQRIRYLPATAQNCVVNNVEFLYFNPVNNMNLCPATEVPTLFEITAAVLFSHRALQSHRFPLPLVRRVREIRTCLRQCTECLKVFSRKSFVAKRYEKNTKGSYCHYYCRQCYQRHFPPQLVKEQMKVDVPTEPETTELVSPPTMDVN